MKKLPPNAISRSSCVQKDETFHQFLKIVGDFGSPHARQFPGGRWQTVKGKISDPVLASHINQECWVGKKGSWYPYIFTLDFDHPKEGVFEEVCERLQLSDGMMLPMTSPSFARSGNFHVALNLEKNARPVTLHRGLSFLQKMVGDLCEVYPQKRRKFRLPFGRDQFLLSKHRMPIKDYSLRECLHWLDKVEPIDAVFSFTAVSEENALPPRQRVSLPPYSEAGRLWREGLQAHGTRHYSQFLLAIYLARSNYQPEEAKRLIQHWIRNKHNQFSKDARSGKWRSIDAEIERQVDWIWEHEYFYPDQVHNLQGRVTRADLNWIVKTFRGDVVNQKRLFNLVCYYRARCQHEWVYIPVHVWRNRIANDRTYKSFIATLEKKRLLRCNWSYSHQADSTQSFCRSFRLKLPTTSEPVLQEDGRNFQEYYETLRHLFPCIRDRVAYTGVACQNFYNHEKKEDVVPLMELAMAA
jgi:hypothetical protein